MRYVASTWPPPIRNWPLSVNTSWLTPALNCGSARSTPSLVKIAMKPSSPPVATRPAFPESATLRAPSRVSMKRSGSRHSSTSGAVPFRVNAYAVWSMTMAVIPCFCSAVAEASAEARSLYEIRTTYGLVVAGAASGPSCAACAAASSGPANGPIVTSACRPGAAAVLIEVPRSAALSSVPSSFSRLSRLRRSDHPVSTSLRIRERTSGVRASRYASASARSTPM